MSDSQGQSLLSPVPSPQQGASIGSAIGTAEGAIRVDARKLAGPEVAYDADCAWMEHAPGRLSLFFGKRKRGADRQLQSRLEIRYPPEDFIVTFWANSQKFFESLEGYVSRWSAAAQGASLEPHNPTDWIAVQSHSEWASYTYMSFSGSQAALDFYYLAPSAIAMFKQTQQAERLRLDPVVRIQMTSFDLAHLASGIRSQLDEIRRHIPADDLQRKDALTVKAQLAAGASE